MREMAYIDFLKKSNAYKTIARDKIKGRMSQSYLVICRDVRLNRFYLKALAKLIMCPNDDEFCDECRACRMIDKELSYDCTIYPKEGEKIKAEDIDRLAGEFSYTKPLEGDNKLFVIVGAENMLPVSQNKLLKTLEEPPKGVYILLGAQSEAPLLPTVKSRCRKLEIPLFSSETIYETLKDDYPDKSKLKLVSELVFGQPGLVEEVYNGSRIYENVSLAFETLSMMTSSSQLPAYSTRIAKLEREAFIEYIEVLKLVMRDILMVKEGKQQYVFIPDRIEETEKMASRFETGSLISLITLLGDITRRTDFYANANMLADKVLFAILEERYKWQKLSE